MADEKKISAKSAAVAVLKKFEELLVKAEKDGKSLKGGFKTGAEHQAEGDKRQAQIAQKEVSQGNPEKPEGALMTPKKMAKQDASAPQPSQPSPTLGETATSGGTSTINNAIGNPFGKQEDGQKEFKGHIKLAKFIGHISGKKSGKGPLPNGETGHEKGINTSTDPSQKSRVMMGTSKAGSTLPGHANDPKQKQEDESEAKGKHKQVLGEMKQMPKPKLPG